MLKFENRVNHNNNQWTQSWLWITTTSKCHFQELQLTIQWFLKDPEHLIDQHTHTRLTAISPGLPGWASTRKVKPIWILLEQETVSGSGISWGVCKSAPRCRQITTPAPHHSVFYRPDALPAAQPTVSKHWSLIDQSQAFSMICQVMNCGYSNMNKVNMKMHKDEHEQRSAEMKYGIKVNYRKAKQLRMSK